MLDEDMDINSKASTAMFLLGYCNLACDVDRGRRAVLCIEPLIRHPDLTPINQLWCHMRLGYYYYLVGQYRKGLDALESSMRVKEAHGLQGFGGSPLLIASHQIVVHTTIGDLRSARRCLDKMIAAVDPARPTDMDTVAHGTAHVEGAAGNYLMVAGSGAKKSALSAATGMVFLEILGTALEATGAALLGEPARLHGVLAKLRRVVAGTCFAFFECEARLLEAYVDLVHGDVERGRRLLSDAMTFAREMQFQYPQMARSSIIPGVLMAEALRLGIEADHVRDTIRRLTVRPPADAPESWPWPVKIFTLGRLEVWCDGQKLEFNTKAPRRVLALLRAIVAAGGEPVAIAHLIDTLWPDDEGDAARKTLDVTLVRLRRLLGNAERILVRDEQVTLNRDLCWVDAWAFARNVEAVERGEDPPQVLLSMGLRALESYRGSFLPADPDDPGAVVMRLRLRDLLARLVSTLGGRLEAAGDWDAALGCYRRGIDADELAEEFYQGVMRCHAAMGRHAEGMAAYRRLRETLSVVLGVGPSVKSEQLMHLMRSSRLDRLS
jgi:DNA-binding SARP family transcriptional activator